MTTYAVLLMGDENRWAAASDDERAAVFARHDEFAKRLAERGDEVVGGAELAHSSGARTLRPAADGSQTVTDGPYAEATEQLGGFYLVTTDDPAGLLEACRVLGETGDTLEVRATVEAGGQRVRPIPTA